MSDYVHQGSAKKRATEESEKKPRFNTPFPGGLDVYQNVDTNQKGLDQVLLDFFS